MAEAESGTGTCPGICDDTLFCLDLSQSCRRLSDKSIYAIMVMVAQEAETFYDRLLRRASNANLGFVAVLGRLSSTAVSCFRRR